MSASAPEESVAQATPDQIGKMLPSRPTLSSDPMVWNGVTLQKYRHPPGSIDIPAVRDNVVVVNLAGAALIEDKQNGTHLERRWTDSGHMSLTPAGQSILRVIKGRPEVLLIHIDQRLVHQVAEATYDVDPGRVLLNPRLAVPDETLGSLARLLLDEAEQVDPASSCAADMLIRTLVIHLLRYHSSIASRILQPLVFNPTGRLQRVIGYMQEHLKEALPLPELARIIGLSHSQFARAFRGATGEPPHRYLIQLRVQRACELLEQTDLSVIEVALRCGFEQPNHFATMFRKITGMSPRAWRMARRA